MFLSYINRIDILRIHTESTKIYIYIYSVNDRYVCMDL